MFKVLLNSISEKVSLTDEETRLAKTFFTPKKLRKRQYLLQEGDVCKYLAFTEAGLLRLYSVDEKGVEHMMQFAAEGWWIVDIYSFLTGEPSRFNIDAMEDSELLLLSHENFEAALKALPAMERYFRILFQNNIIAKERRLESAITHGAEERYRQFEQAYPGFAQHIPLNLIASYLGITPETLSRVRRNLARKK